MNIFSLILIVSIFINNIFTLRESQVTFEKKLPELSFIDINNENIDIKNSLGKYILVLFVNDKDENDIYVFNNIQTKWDQDDFKIFIFTDNYRKIKEKVNIINKNIIISESDYLKHKEIFKAEKCCSNYFLYDPSGNLVKVGRNSDGYENGISYAIGKLIKNKVFNINEYVQENSRIDQYKWFGQIKNILAQHIFALY